MFLGELISLFVALSWTVTALFALTPILIIAPTAVLFHQKVTVREVSAACISVVGVCLCIFEIYVHLHPEFQKHTV